jgi:hypothetical protein
MSVHQDWAREPILNPQIARINFRVVLNARLSVAHISEDFPIESQPLPKPETSSVRQRMLYLWW